MSDERGFIRVDCPSCRNPDVWFRCNGCGKSDQFLLSRPADGAGETSQGAVICACAARYSQGNCTCGATVPFEGLRFVPFEKGPMALADLEIAWGRVAVLGVAAVSVIGLVAWWALG